MTLLSGVPAARLSYAGRARRGAHAFPRDELAKGKGPIYYSAALGHVLRVL